MEELLNREIYGSQGAQQIEAMGALAVSIANRWQQGWPERVKSLIEARIYLVNLDAQIERELEARAGAVDLQSLTQEPPIWQLTKQSNVTFLDDNAIWPLPLFVTYQGSRTEEQMVIETTLRRHQAAFTW
ncbi:hypothetical protein [Rhodoferax sp. U11-2br]|uniref:hypothetical protein n=1 Tax=Rhodoferax sp. U11-2br TaxID=2838878 RepID=UPI001BEB5F50|nr:hypothetical protein [Rhodoferax sp. U11-2br]MBT3066270.1 hypothetical protein [Rhodoferax sp. U11-2br]